MYVSEGCHLCTQADWIEIRKKRKGTLKLNVGALLHMGLTRNQMNLDVMFCLAWKLGRRIKNS